MCSDRSPAARSISGFLKLSKLGSEPWWIERGLKPATTRFATTFSQARSRGFSPRSIPYAWFHFAKSLRRNFQLLSDSKRVRIFQLTFVLIENPHVLFPASVDLL